MCRLSALLRACEHLQRCWDTAWTKLCWSSCSASAGTHAAHAAAALTATASRSSELWWRRTARPDTALRSSSRPSCRRATCSGCCWRLVRVCARGRSNARSACATAANRVLRRPACQVDERPRCVRLAANWPIIRSAGTNDDDLCRLVVSRCEVDLADIKVAFQAQVGAALSTWVHEETSGARQMPRATTHHDRRLPRHTAGPHQLVAVIALAPAAKDSAGPVIYGSSMQSTSLTYILRQAKIILIMIIINTSCKFFLAMSFPGQRAAARRGCAYLGWVESFCAVIVQS